MSNPHNILRPPILNTSTNTDRPATSNTNATMSEQELVNLITKISSEVVNRQGPLMVQSTINPNANTNSVIDQCIEERYANNLGDLDKIPDVVKCLRDFDGNPSEFISWKKSVERILKIYENDRGTPKYYGIINVVRNKIKGKADMALESYNTPLDWGAIAKCLALHYADKRDISTLEYQLSALAQGNKSVEEFYQLVYSHLSLILNKIGCMEVGAEALNLLTMTYRDKALDTFIRGLNGDLPKLLGMKEPIDLPQALHLCLKLENQKFRSNHVFANNNNSF